MLRQNCHIILASNSNSRKSILAQSNINFDAISPKFDEDNEKYNYKLTPDKLVIKLATMKAMSLANQFHDSYIIGSDQLCQLDEDELFKSYNQNDAINQLKMLRNKTHIQNNATVIIHKNKIIFQNYTKASLTMHNLNDEEIVNYVKYDNPIGCAGSYKFESMGKFLFSNVEGSYHGILGLDIIPILTFLYKNNLISWG